MKKAFTFDLGNRGLLPEEADLVVSWNATLLASATKHNRLLKHTSPIMVKVVKVAGTPVLRTARVSQAPVDLTLASAWPPRD